jgi:hypothetical protein
MGDCGHIDERHAMVAAPAAPGHAYRQRHDLRGPGAAAHTRAGRFSLGIALSRDRRLGQRSRQSDAGAGRKHGAIDGLVQPGARQHPRRAACRRRRSGTGERGALSHHERQDQRPAPGGRGQHHRRRRRAAQFHTRLANAGHQPGRARLFRLSPRAPRPRPLRQPPGTQQDQRGLDVLPEPASRNARWPLRGRGGGGHLVRLVH